MLGMIAKLPGFRISALLAGNIMGKGSGIISVVVIYPHWTPENASPQAVERSKRKGQRQKKNAKKRSPAKKSHSMVLFRNVFLPFGTMIWYK